MVYSQPLPFSRILRNKIGVSTVAGTSSHHPYNDFMEASKESVQRHAAVAAAFYNPLHSYAQYPCSAAAAHSAVNSINPSTGLTSSSNPMSLHGIKSEPKYMMSPINVASGMRSSWPSSHSVSDLLTGHANGASLGFRSPTGSASPPMVNGHGHQLGQSGLHTSDPSSAVHMAAAHQNPYPYSYYNVMQYLQHHQNHGMQGPSTGQLSPMMPSNVAHALHSSAVSQQSL